MIAFLQLALICLVSCDHTAQRTQKASESISSAKIEPLDLGGVKFRIYRDNPDFLSRRVEVLTLQRSAQDPAQDYPNCPAAKNLRNNEQIKSDSLPFNLRIPYPVSYKNLRYFNLLSLIFLDNNAVYHEIPKDILDNLQNRGIKFDAIPVAIALYEHAKPGVYNYYTHYWAHDVIKIDTNKSINVASGFFDVKGVNVFGLANAVGIDELKTHAALVHPISEPRPGLSPDNAQFRLTGADAASFWALSVDVDENSPHKSTAILIFTIILKRGDLRNKRFVRLHRLSYEKLINKDPNPCIDYTIQDFIEELSSISHIDDTSKKYILGKLNQLIR